MNSQLIRPYPKKRLPDIARLVCLVGLLGVTLSAAFLPHFAPDQLGWVIAHLE
jgi:hypothetical protein